MGQDYMKLRAGDWVQVLAWDDIEQTLDADGTLDGLPFMPEMLEFCGRRYQVLRYAEKICLEVPGGKFVGRAFRTKDILLLAGLRCSGLHHDGCQRSCVLLWKTAWLRKSVSAQAAGETTQVTQALDYPYLRVKKTPTEYFCQATELYGVSHDLRREDTLSQIMTDLRTGSIGFFPITSS